MRQNDSDKQEYRPFNLETGQNPRKAPWRHRERSVKRFEYTFEDIAQATGLSVRSLYNHVAKGDLDPASLVSVSAFIVTRRLKKPEK